LDPSSPPLIHTLNNALGLQQRKRIGFGCAHLYDGRGRASALHLVDAAIDSGISYFDTARLYGHGRAEHVLGEAIAGRRDKLILASKAGILPVEQSFRRRAWSKGTKVIRQVTSRVGIRLPAAKPPEPMFGMFAPADIRASLETSLRALRTDYLDIFLLHECSADHARDPELLDLLQMLVAEGKIRAFGTATQPETTRNIALNPSSSLDVLQFKSDFTDTALAAMERSSRGRLLVTHSHLGPAFQAFLDFIDTNKSGYDDLFQTLDLAPEDRHAWGQCLLSLALHANPDGFVLFSSTRVENIQSAAAAVAPDADALAALHHLIAAFKQSLP